MALKTRGIITQVKKEATFNTAPTFTDADVIITEKTDVNPKVDTVERKSMSCSMIDKAGIPVRFTTEGSIDLEIDVKTNAFLGDVLFEAGLGAKLANGAIINANNIEKKSDGSGDATLYTVSDADVDRISLAIKKYFDSGDVVLQALGNVINKVDLEFKQADILSASFGLEGASYQTLTGQTVPACSNDDSVPLVGKNATFEYKGNSVCAKDIKVSIDNTITSTECITSEGYGDKTIVGKKISGSFTCLLEDFSYLNDLTNQTAGKLFLNISHAGKQIALYLPQIKITDAPITDDSNSLIEVTVNFIAEKAETEGEALMLAVKA